ncbi:MAG: hypothetical protein GF418_15210 [Chitinivibrionales bacterium]|nr:hypothetical protein [Chitinivibrionales bacterium]MBD3396970.1 hypothetical protein [Chitinivibrionales bacterium]
MAEKTLRKPVSNFFIKKSIQLNIIGKILLVMLISVLVMTVLLAWIYNAKSQAGSFYYMSNNIMEDLKLQSILGLVLPPLFAAQIVSLLIGIGIGLFSSRKVAVPLYKIEKWASALTAGQLKTRLAFREDRQMQDLTRQCNLMAETYRDIFARIDKSVRAIESSSSDDKKVAVEAIKIREILEKVQFGES